MARPGPLWTLWLARLYLPHVGLPWPKSLLLMPAFFTALLIAGEVPCDLVADDY